MQKKANDFGIAARPILNWLPVILWATVIFSFSAYPTTKASEINWQDFIIKKTAHFVEYAVLAILLYRSFVLSGVPKKQAGIYSVILSFFYGVSDELHQSLTPGREPRLRDSLIDGFGAFAAIYGINTLLPKAPKRFKKIAEKLKVL